MQQKNVKNCQNSFDRFLACRSLCEENIFLPLSGRFAASRRGSLMGRRRPCSAASLPPDRSRSTGDGYRISNISQFVYVKSCKENRNFHKGLFIRAGTATGYRVDARGILGKKGAPRFRRAPPLSGGFQHIFNENAISFGGIIQQNMGHGPHQFSVLQDGAAAHG